MFKILKNHWRFVAVFIIVIIVSFLRFEKGIIQQDNYLGYSEFFTSSKFLSYADSRLFPGLPFLIFALNLLVHNSFLSGYLITILSFVGSYWLLYKLTGSKYSFVALAFPPVMLGQATLIATEFSAIFLILSGIYLTKIKKYFWASLLIGLSFWVRPIAALSFIMPVVEFIKQRRFKTLLKNLAVFLFPVLLLLVYNSTLFGAGDLFHQFDAYQNLGRPVIGLFQIVADMIRTFRWGWFRILISGSFYLFIFAFLFTISVKEKFKKSNDLQFGVLTAIFAMTAYVFSFTSNPFLENLGRYLVPIFPLFWILLYNKFRSKKLALLLISISLVAVLI